ncbi:MAG: Cof-type HAD-IIB family hydrolase [Erysipelotrichaceae bacterium]|nr:Cof-type HAD-IIB family hydrolase [Erysipelotrichaceae bacterium]
MSIKAILLDIDGTLTNSQKEITPLTKQTLLKAQSQGIRLVIASGRPTRGIEKYGELLNMQESHGLYLCLNGAKVVYSMTKEELVNVTMDQEIVTEALQHVKQFDVHPVVIEKDHMVVENVYNAMVTFRGQRFNGIEHEARINDYLLKEERDLVSYVNFPLNKILLVGEPEYLRAHYKEISAPFEGRLSMMFSADFFYELTTFGIDKGSAIKRAFDQLDIKPEEVIAFGDAGNDISMLKYAGIGVAMENAQDEVKAIADEITDDNDHDGIAKALLKHIPSLG